MCQARPGATEEFLFILTGIFSGQEVWYLVHQHVVLGRASLMNVFAILFLERDDFSAFAFNLFIQRIVTEL